MSAIPETVLCFAGFVGSVGVGSFIFSISLDPKEPLSLLPTYLAILLQIAPNSAAAVFNPWVKYTSSSAGLGFVYSLLVEVTAAAYGLNRSFFILAIVAYSFSDLFVIMLIKHYYPHQYLDGNCSNSDQYCICFTLRLSRISYLYCSLAYLHTSIYRTLALFHRRLPMRNWMLPSPHIFIICPFSCVKRELNRGTYWLDTCTYVFTGNWQTCSQSLKQDIQ